MDTRRRLPSASTVRHQQRQRPDARVLGAGDASQSGPRWQRCGALWRADVFVSETSHPPRELGGFDHRRPRWEQKRGRLGGSQGDEIYDFIPDFAVFS